jgi:putative transposase
VPRIARVVAVGVPHHVTQRGNNRQQIFFTDLDRRFYLMLLRHHGERHGFRILGWCLMTNHVHIVGIPEHEESLARALGRAHNAYTIYLNRRKMRSGHLWQNRFFSAPLDRDHLHTALRYVDLNPVRAGLVAQAVEYLWSSAEAHVNGRDEWSLLDRETWRRISTRNDWADALRDRVMEADEMARLRKATKTGRPLGSETFVGKLEARLRRTLKRRKTGPSRRIRATAAG